MPDRSQACEEIYKEDKTLITRSCQFPPARPRVGLLGGSFNPAHEGHLHIAKEALRLLQLDEIWLLVSPQNPLKSSQGMLPLVTRIRSAQKIVAKERAIRVTALETRLGTRYTKHTLERLKRHYPDTEFVWMMGADNLIQMPKWRGWLDIMQKTPIAVFARPSYDLRALAGLAAHRFRQYRIPHQRGRLLASRQAPAWMFMEIRRHPASATAIRKGLRL